MTVRVVATGVMRVMRGLFLFLFSVRERPADYSDDPVRGEEGIDDVGEGRGRFSSRVLK